MSSSLSSVRHVANAYDGERDGHAENNAQSPDGVDSDAPQTGIRSKLKRFWQRTRITSVMKKVVEGSKLLLIRLNPRSKPHPNPEPVQSGRNETVESRVEVVKFPDYMIPSPADSSNEAYYSTSALVLTTSDTDRGKSVQKSVPATASASQPTTNDKAIGDTQAPLETSDGRSHGGFRYREKLEKQKRFPEIELGVVSSRVKWLEPLMSGEKAEDKNSIQEESGVERDANDKVTEKAPPALEIHDSGGLAPLMHGNRVEDIPYYPESSEDSVFDDSPRLYKHRLPEEEPKPWVEPGTVAKGEMWLRPVLSGAKRSGSGESQQGNLKSPRRITQNAFC